MTETVSLDLRFRDAQHLRSESHSFTNLINVIHAELQLLERMCEPETGLKPLIRVCETVVRAFKSESFASGHAGEMSDFPCVVNDILERLRPLNEYRRDASDAIRMIRNVLDDASLRTQEMFARYSIPRPAVEYSYDRLVDLTAGPWEADVRIRANADLVLPARLPEAVRDLAHELVELGAGPVRVAFLGESGGVVAIDSKPPGLRMVPDRIPESFSGSVEDRIRARLARLFYLVQPDGTVEVNPTGTPIVRVLLSGSSGL